LSSLSLREHHAAIAVAIERAAALPVISRLEAAQALVKQQHELNGALILSIEQLQTLTAHLVTAVEQLRRRRGRH
jgi:hypothetical protein